MTGRRRDPGPVAACLLVLLWGAVAQADFTEVGGALGLNTGGPKEGGLCWADFNEDGWLDVVVHRSSRSYLYVSSGGADPTFSDETATLAPALEALGAGRSCVAADFNNDGHVDLFRMDYDRLQVLLNTGPGGSPPFGLGSAAGDVHWTIDEAMTPPHVMNGEGGGVIDVDGNGCLDLVFQNESGHRIYLNPDGCTADFVEYPEAMSGVPAGPDMDGGGGDFMVVGDFDVDGDVDFAGRLGAFSDVFENLGDGTFRAIEPDLTAGGGSKNGSVFCDFDNDGDFDFYFGPGDRTDPGVAVIWLQTAPRTFENSGTPAIPTTVESTGVACGDVDNDGDLDLFLANRAADRLFVNQLADSGALAFVERDVGITGDDIGYGSVFVDYDRDGDLDLFVNQSGPFDAVTRITAPADSQMWRNDQDDQGYLMVRVMADVGGGCPSAPVLRDDIGAVISLTGDGHDSGVREVNGGTGRGTQDPPLVHFGLPPGPDATYAVTVRFQHGAHPDATIEVVPSDLGAYHVLEVVASDPDGDGIPTDVEMADAGGTADLDGDGLPAWHDPDADGDGIPDGIEAGDADPCTEPADADDDGTPDYLQVGLLVDSDGDSVPDTTDRDPDDRFVCADTDGDGCDDCSVAGMAAPGNDGPDADGDGQCDPPGADGGVPMDAGDGLLEAHGSGCTRCATITASGSPSSSSFAPLALLALLAWRRRRRR